MGVEISDDVPEHSLKTLSTHSTDNALKSPAYLEAGPLV
jgi:hypothetical protein